MGRKPNKKEQEEISAGVVRRVAEWEETGKIKTSRAEYEPRNKKAAIRQALAIEYGEHRVSHDGDEDKAGFVF